jgi:hypothetical protein
MPTAGSSTVSARARADDRFMHPTADRHLTEHGKRSTVANVAVARELVGFLWAAMTNQPLRATDSSNVNPDQEAAA